MNYWPFKRDSAVWREANSRSTNGIPCTLHNVSFIAMLTRACRWALSEGRRIESQSSHPVHLRFILILSLCLCMVLWSLPFWFSDFLVSSVRAICCICLLTPLCSPQSLSPSLSWFYSKTVPECACFHVLFSIIQIKHCMKLT
jgi:hypothetical protein